MIFAHMFGYQYKSDSDVTSSSLSTLGTTEKTRWSSERDRRYVDTNPVVSSRRFDGVGEETGENNEELKTRKSLKFGTVSNKLKVEIQYSVYAVKLH